MTIGKASPQPAWIIAREDAAWLQSTVQQRAGTYPMTLNFHGRKMDSGLHVTVGTRGDLTFSREDDQPQRQPEDETAGAI